MHLRAPGVLLCGIVALAGGAGLSLALDARAAQKRQAGSRAFQQCVGGLGFGPAVDLSPCAFSFDPRLCPDCSLKYGPIPGGIYFCVHHACSVLCYPPLPEGPALPGD